MQKCNCCGASWELNANVSKCPFCDAILTEGEDPISSIDDAILVIINNHGEEIFLQGNRFLGLLGDYAPFLTRERKLIKIAVESGAYKAIYESTDAERKSTYNRYVKVLTDSFFLDDYWARTVLSWCYNAISPSKINITHINSSLNSQSKRTNTSTDITSSDIAISNDDPSDLWTELYGHSMDHTEVKAHSIMKKASKKTDGQILFEKLQRERQQNTAVPSPHYQNINQYSTKQTTPRKTDGQILAEKLHRERQQNTTVPSLHYQNINQYSTKQATPRKTDGQILAEKLHREQQQSHSSLSSQYQYKQRAVARQIAPQKTDGQMLFEKLQREKNNDQGESSPYSSTPKSQISLAQSNQCQLSDLTDAESHPILDRLRNIINGKKSSSNRII